jgi:hypothetical protein
VTAARRVAPKKTLTPGPGGRLTPVEAAQVEAEDDTTEDGATAVTLAGEQIRIKPSGQWRSSAIRALSGGNFDAWAESSLADDDSWETWQDIDPTIDQVETMLREWRTATGQSPGESGPSRRSSKRTARR